MRQPSVPLITTDVAYATCQQICRGHARTFYLACRLLPTVKQRAIWAVYAFCRHADDLVDRPRAEPAAIALAAWRDELLRAYDGCPTHPITVALADVLRTYPIPLQPALDLLAGVEMDIAPRLYATWEDLRLYCYRVAATVGLLTLPVLGARSPEASTYAVDLGLAMQLTNILRDVGEDARMGRIYLPLDEMRRFGYSTARLRAGQIDPSFRGLMRFQIERARDYYARAQPGIRLLDPDARLPVHLASALYGQILNQIEANGCDVFSRRAHLSTMAKLYHGLLAVRYLPSLSSRP
jgi:phytoene synthase